MKKIILISTILTIGLTSCKTEKKEAIATNKEVKVKQVVLTNNVNVDVATSIIYWEGSKSLGDAHNGTISLKEGSLAFENNALIGGKFVIDMNSIKNLDIKNTNFASKLEAHLKNADFFDVEKYPTAKFVITNLKKEGKILKVTGNLTIKDITKSISIPATITKENGIITLQSESFNINRADFNIKYKSKSFFDVKKLKDKVINDLIEISFTVKAKE